MSVLIKNISSTDSNTDGVLVDIEAKIVTMINNRFINLSNESMLSQSAITFCDMNEVQTSGILPFSSKGLKL